MKGLEISVTNSDLVMKQEERLIKLFVMFKDKKYGTKYVIFTDNEQKELFYGNPLVNGKKMIIMKFKDIKDAEMVKEFVWKYLNKESISNFEIIEIPELDKLEIIDNNTLDVKEEYIETLIEIFIKGKEIVEEIPKEMKKTKKKSKLPLLITLIFIGGIVGGIIYLRNNPELIYGKNIYVECKKKYEISELTVNSSELVTLTFNNSQILTKHEKVITYIFDDSDNYYDFKERNLQYQYLNDSGLENFDESTLTYQLYVDYDLGKIYTLPRDYDELYDYYKNNGYSCNNIEK